MMLKALILATFLGLVSAFDYCTLGTSNTMCKYRPGVTGPKCMQVYPMSVTADDKATILAAHNDLRRKVAKGLETRGNPGPQPPASNMRELTWDDELATMAQTWANQCNYAHDYNRNVARFNVGQNIAVLFSIQTWHKEWNDTITGWYNEAANMDRAYVANFPWAPAKGVIGHYTQVVWATTYKIGCGIISYYDNVYMSVLPYKLFYVCNYGPAGNWYSSPVYTVGAAASACPAGTVAKNGLCA